MNASPLFQPQWGEVERPLTPLQPPAQTQISGAAAGATAG
jgi:hypothetical protein